MGFIYSFDQSQAGSSNQVDFLLSDDSKSGQQQIPGLVDLSDRSLSPLFLQRALTPQSAGDHLLFPPESAFSPQSAFSPKSLADHPLSVQFSYQPAHEQQQSRLLDCSDNDPLLNTATFLVAFNVAFNKTEGGGMQDGTGPQDEPGAQNKKGAQERPAAAQGEQQAENKGEGQKKPNDEAKEGSEDLPPSRRAKEAREAGDLIGEEEALKEVLKQQLTSAKRDEISIANTRHQLTKCLEQQGLIPEARKEIDTAVAGLEKVTDKHPLKKPFLGLFLSEGAAFVIREAADLGKAGKKEEAATKLADAEKMYVRAIGLLDSVENPTLKKFFEPGTASVYKDYAWLLEKAGQKEKAAEYNKKANGMSTELMSQAQFNKAAGEEMRKAGLLPDAAAEMKELNKQLGDLEKQSRQPLTDEQKQKLIEQLNQQVLQMERIRLGLPKDATPAQIKKAIRDEVGLPETASEADVSRAHRAKSLGLNPLKATEDEIRKADEKRHFETMCKLYKLDAQKATKDDIKKAQEKADFEYSCKLYKLDPQKATKDDIKKAQEKSEIEFWCRELKLDPAKTTREQINKVLEFRSQCYLYKINPEAKDAAEQVHKQRCKSYGLPENATPEQLDKKIKEEQEKWKKQMEERRSRGFDFYEPSYLEPRFIDPRYDR